MARQMRLLAMQLLTLCAGAALWLLVFAMLPGDALAVSYALFKWLLCPVLGGGLTVRAVLKGLQPYIALWALPLCPALMQLLVTGTALDIGVILIYAVLGVVCASVGDELRKRRARRELKKLK